MAVDVLSNLLDSLKHFSRNFVSYLINITIFLAIAGFTFFIIMFWVYSVLTSHGINVIKGGMGLCLIAPLSILFLLIVLIWFSALFLEYIKRANSDPKVSIIDILREYISIDFLKGRLIKYVVNFFALYIAILIMSIFIALIFSTITVPFMSFINVDMIYMLVIEEIVVFSIIIPWMILGSFSILDNKPLSRTLSFLWFSFTKDGILSGFLYAVYAFILSTIILNIKYYLGVLQSPVISMIVQILAFFIYFVLIYPVAIDYFYRIYLYLTKGGVSP